MDKLEEARKNINRIDKEMADLFIERMNNAKTIANYKAERGLPILDTSREHEIIMKNSEYVSDEVLREYYVSFLQSSMDISKKYQQRLISGLRIAYSGVEGAFANIAAKRIFPQGELCAYKSFDAAYAAVAEGECDCCVLPIENSNAGEVGPVVDLLLDGNLFVNGIYSLKISQNLIGVKGTKQSDVKTVISHPQALSQCEKYINDHGFTVVESVNTAVAAKSLMENGDKSVAAIGSADAAELYDLEIIDHDINASSVNTTKFAVLSRSQFEPNGPDRRFILLFICKHGAGALAEAINAISKYGFNMKALRSRTLKNSAWDYYFYVEAEGDEKSEKGKLMLEELATHCVTYKVAGHYTKVKDLGK